ncbi:WD domain, G-beta repeat-containing protein [Acanthamoeba castellanii str. Neff]|uniref:WD domain, G-beta repeat-containing protein n=1 Tax=Acanthamoeba castellanii (strain ATCC 30010 / Neff) TaxID=1257118 RepID=L8GN16_ACACF|nr:WD domain, G-beta repeat-containing protein [Acanthamoeba castellanii str. Neff]ELR14387.1 WD domain, G-beta repeat-containing protein [Acanthamoeba castellanii str. Neff]
MNTAKMMTGDRFIPDRNGINFDISHFNLTSSSSSKENVQQQQVQIASPAKERFQSSLSDAMFGGDASAVKSTKVLAFKHKAPAASASFQNQMRTLYSANKAAKGTASSSAGSSSSTRRLPSVADKVLDAPGIRDDYYLNLLDWSAQNTLAVALDRSLYLWNATTSDIDMLFEMPDTDADDYITSVSWMADGNILAVVERDGTQLASGGNDNILNVWDEGRTEARFRLDHHTSAVKAVAWCPWQAGLLASGGGAADRCIKMWNTRSGACVNSVDTGSQVCGLVWSRTHKELVSSHGYSQNQLAVWKYPTMAKVGEMHGHTSRVLFMSLSPDGQTIVSGAGDERLRFWNVWPTATTKAASSTAAAAAKSEEKAAASSRMYHIR